MLLGAHVEVIDMMKRRGGICVLHLLLGMFLRHFGRLARLFLHIEHKPHIRIAEQSCHYEENKRQISNYATIFALFWGRYAIPELKDLTASLFAANQSSWITVDMVAHTAWGLSAFNYECFIIDYDRNLRNENATVASQKMSTANNLIPSAILPIVHVWQPSSRILQVRKKSPTTAKVADREKRTWFGERWWNFPVFASCTSTLMWSISRHTKANRWLCLWIWSREKVLHKGFWLQTFWRGSRNRIMILFAGRNPSIILGVHIPHGH